MDWIQQWQSNLINKMGWLRESGQVALATPDWRLCRTVIFKLDIVETIRLKLQYHRDPERAEQIKQIKGW